MLDSLSHPQALPDPDHSGHAWPDEGLRWVQEPRKHAPGLDSLLTWAFRAKASRIGFQTGHPVWVRHPRPQPPARPTRRSTRASSRRSSTTSMAPTAWRGCKAARISTPPTRSRSTARRGCASGSTPRRPAPPARRRQYRAAADRRHAALARRAAGRAGHPRALPARAKGMVIVSGGTGSGKSTLIAGMTVAKLMDPDGHYNIVEGAAPVEFLLERVRGPSSTMNQTEIPRDLPSLRGVHPRLHAPRADRHHRRRMPRQRDHGRRDPGGDLRPRADHHGARQRRAAHHAAHRQPVRPPASATI